MRHTRTKMSGTAKRMARSFIGDYKGEVQYAYVPDGEPIIVGFTGTDASVLDFRADEALPPPKVRLSAPNSPVGMQWLTATIALGSWAAFKWKTPSKTTETLIVKTALRADLLPGDLGYLDRRVSVLRVMAATGQPSQLAGPVVAEVGREYATDGILLATWLRNELGSPRAATAWLAEHHPSVAGSKSEDDIRAFIAGSGYGTKEWYDLSRILRGAHRFTHLRSGRRR